MKNLIFCVLIFLAVNLFCTKKNFAQCSDLSITTIYYDSVEHSIKGELLNAGSWYVIYPIYHISVDTNTYISANNFIIPSYLDSAGGTNNGINPYFFQATLHVPCDSIPANTLISGTITVTDPNDTSIVCVLPFQWPINCGSLTTSINELELNRHLTIYPNPLTSNNLTVRIDYLRPSRLEIFDLTGKLIFQNKVNASSQIQQIDLSGIKNGSYIIKVLTDEGWMSKKLIKM